MKIYKVWHPEVETRDEAKDLVASDRSAAAEKYVENDPDGQREGLYAGPTGSTLKVEDPLGEVHEVRVWVDFEPTITTARQVP